MRRVATFFEVFVSATLLMSGLYMLYEAGSNKSLDPSAILIGGAVCFTVGVMTLTSAVRSILWHRKMLRHAIGKDYWTSVH